MKVLVVTNMYPPHHYGGYEVLCAQTVDHMLRSGHEVAVLTSDIAVPDAGPSRWADHRVHRSLRIYWEDHEILRPGPLGALRVERANREALRRALAAERPDVVSVWNMGAMSLGLLEHVRAAAVPAVHVVCDDWLVYAPRLDRWTAAGRRAGSLARSLQRLVGLPSAPTDLGRHGTFCFISETTRRTAEAEGGWEFDNGVLSYCGISLEEFPLVTDRHPRPWRGRLLVSGRIDERKGIATAVAALAELPDVSLTVDGRGDERHRAELEALAARLGVADRVTFTVSDRADLAAAYRSADAVLFLPRWAEPFGMVPVEAMACGTPVVATGTGGSGEYLVDGWNCLMVGVDDAAAVAEAVRRLAADEELRERLRLAGLATAKEVDIEKFLAVIDDAHRAAAGGSRVRGRVRLAEVLGPRG